MAKEGKAPFTTIHPKVKKGFSKEFVQWANDKDIQHMDHRNFLYLTKVKVDYRIIEAALSFWDKKNEEFAFGDNKLCPTLEEVAAIVGVPLNLDISIPVRKNNYGNVWSAVFGNVSKNLFDSEVQCIPYEELYEKYSAWRRNFTYGTRLDTWTKMFELCLFGEVLFGRTNNSLDLSILTLLRDFYDHRCIVPTLLAHLITQLNREEFGGSTVILYIWICEHFPTPISRPLQAFEEQEGDIIPLSYNQKKAMYLNDDTCYVAGITEKFTFNKWVLHYQKENEEKVAVKETIDLWENLLVNDITWIREWGATRVSRSFIIGVQLPKVPFADIILLPMFDGTVAYQPYRFLRQFGYKQEVPPFQRYDSELRFFIRSGNDTKERIAHIWKHAVHIKNYSEVKASKKIEEHRFEVETSIGYRMWIQGLSKSSGPSAPISMTKPRYEDMQARMSYLESENRVLEGKCKKFDESLKKQREDLTAHFNRKRPDYDQLRHQVRLLLDENSQLRYELMSRQHYATASKRAHAMNKDKDGDPTEDDEPSTSNPPKKKKKN